MIPVIYQLYTYAMSSNAISLPKVKHQTYPTVKKLDLIYTSSWKYFAPLLVNPVKVFNTIEVYVII